MMREVFGTLRSQDQSSASSTTKVLVHDHARCSPVRRDSGRNQRRVGKAREHASDLRTIRTSFEVRSVWEQVLTRAPGTLATASALPRSTRPAINAR